MRAVGWLILLVPAVLAATRPAIAAAGAAAAGAIVMAVPRARRPVEKLLGRVDRRAGRLAAAVRGLSTTGWLAVLTAVAGGVPFGLYGFGRATGSLPPHDPALIRDMPWQYTSQGDAVEICAAVLLALFVCTFGRLPLVAWRLSGARDDLHELLWVTLLLAAQAGLFLALSNIVLWTVD